MTGIKIPVQADFDSKGVEQQLDAFRQKLNALGNQIAQANKVQFNPVSKTSVQDLQKVTQQFDQLKKISGELNKRVNATGQKGVGFLDLDWAQMYPDAGARARQMAKTERGGGRAPRGREVAGLVIFRQSLRARRQLRLAVFGEPGVELEC